MLIATNPLIPPKLCNGNPKLAFAQQEALHLAMNDLYLLSLRDQRAGHQGQARPSMERGHSSSAWDLGATHLPAPPPYPVLPHTQARLGEGYWEERDRQPVSVLSGLFLPPQAPTSS